MCNYMEINGCIFKVKLIVCELMEYRVITS